MQQSPALTLGTATLGMEYGLSNPSRRPSINACFDLLDNAWQKGIRTLDTAPTYGDSELIIGQWMASRGHLPAIYSKISTVQNDKENISDVILSSIRGSTQRLGVDSIEGIFMHNAADYLRDDVREILCIAKANGQISSVGLSVYDPDEVFRALDKQAPDIIQLPASVLDRRMLNTGALAACNEAQVKVFARSVFLQGALLMRPDDLPDHLAALRRPLEQLRHSALTARISMVELLLRSIQGVKGMNSVLVGAFDSQQLNELLAASNGEPLDEALLGSFAHVGKCIPPSCLDPRTWPK